MLNLIFLVRILKYINMFRIAYINISASITGNICFLVLDELLFALYLNKFISWDMMAFNNEVNCFIITSPPIPKILVLAIRLP